MLGDQFFNASPPRWSERWPRQGNHMKRLGGVNSILDGRRRRER